MIDTHDSPYAVLGLPADADAEAIRSAYRALARKHHPDTGAGDVSAFVAVQQAYDLLSDPNRRKRYDAVRRLLEQTAPPQEDYPTWNPGLGVKQPASGCSILGQGFSGSATFYYPAQGQPAPAGSAWIFYGGTQPVPLSGSPVITTMLRGYTAPAAPNWTSPLPTTPGVMITTTLVDPLVWPSVAIDYAAGNKVVIHGKKYIITKVSVSHATIMGDVEIKLTLLQVVT